MRKIAAALAALLVLILGLVTSTAAAQDDRRAEGASVRASLVIRHVVQEGENLTTDDGLYGEGGIMQHYFGRHRSGDIARLRAYDGNSRVIRVARCDWPDEIPVEERTPLQECPNAYATYTIRRAVGRTIEIPMRWVPTRRLAELLGVTPGVARDMRRIAASVTLPPGSGADDADDDMNGDDPLVDGTPVAAESEAMPDAGPTPLAAGAGNDAGSPLAGGTGGAGGSGGTGDVGGGDAPSDGDLLVGVAVVGTAFMTVLCLFLLIAVGRMLWELVPMLAKDLWRLWRAFRRWMRQRAAAARRKAAEPPFDPETDPRTFRIRQQRETYRLANGDLELEKAAALTRAGTAESEREAARREKDTEQRHRNIAEDTLLKVADAFGLNPRSLFTVGPERKLLVNVVLDHLRQGATLLQKVADWTQPASPWEFALAGEALDVKLLEVRELERRDARFTNVLGRLYQRSLRQRHGLFETITGLRSEIDGLNEGFATNQAESARAFTELLTEKEGLVKRAIQIEDQLKTNGIEPVAWPAAGLPDAPLEKPRRNDEKTEVVFGAEAFARETERQARAAEEAAEPAELEGEPTNAGFRIEDLDGAPKADSPQGESTRTGTTLQGMQAVSGDAPSQPPLPEIAPDKTSPGVGISGSEGMPQGVTVPAAQKRPTIGFEEMHTRDDQTGQIAVPPLGALPNIAPDADPEDDEDEEVPHDNGSGNGSSPLSRTQPVMCGCGQEIAWFDWAQHAGTCPDAGNAQLNLTDEPPSLTGVQPTSTPKKKRRRDRRKNSP